MTALAILLALGYGYWHVTNDDQVAAQAQAYLAKVTGGDVVIKHAHFSLFGPISLQNVSIKMPGDDMPFLEAKSLQFSHDPWALLVRWQIQPTEITCDEPIIRVKQDTTELSNLAYKGSQSRGSQRLDHPPLIRVRKLKIVQIGRAVQPQLGGDDTTLDLSLVPQPPDKIDQKGQDYSITLVEKDRSGKTITTCSAMLNTATGDMSNILGCIPIFSVQRVLPDKYRQWVDQYSLQGDLRVTGKANVSAGTEEITLELDRVAMKLPPSEGGLELTDVNGTINFTGNQVVINKITGRLPQAGNANLTAQGAFSGLKADSPFKIDIALVGVRLPSPDQAAPGDVRTVLATAHRIYQPKGTLDLNATLTRNGAGELEFSGLAHPRNMSMVLDQFVYPMEGVSGDVAFDVAFDRKSVTLRNMTMHHDKVKIALNGEVDLLHAGKYNIGVKATDVVLDDALTKALPPQFAQVFRSLSLKGAFTADVQLDNPPGQLFPEVSVDVTMDGRTSMKYDQFPYPLANLVGKIRVAAGRMEFVEPLKGDNGRMHATIGGGIDRVDSKTPTVDLHITASDMPLDETLYACLQEEGGKIVRSLHAGGLVQRVTAHVTQERGNPIDFNVIARLKDTSLRTDAFPLPLQKVTGVLTITPQYVVIKDLRGIRGRSSAAPSTAPATPDSPIAVDGQIGIGRTDTGLKLTVKADDITLDQELHDALPPDVRDTWDKLSPKGLVDLNVSLATNLPGKPGFTDYDVTLKAKGLEVSYEQFPYRFKGVRGTASAQPGKITLTDMTSHNGRSSCAVNGTILSDAAGDTADLDLHAANLPIDKDLLGAMPSELAPLAERFTPGGTMDANFEHFHIKRTRSTSSGTGAGPVSSSSAPAPAWGPVPVAILPATMPATPATSPTTAPASPWRFTWNAKGIAAIKDAKIDIGFGEETLSGAVTGSAGDDGGLVVDALIAMDSIVVGKQQVTDVRAKIAKKADNSLIRISDISAKSNGGQVEGLAEIRMARPLEYGLSLKVQDIDLEKLFIAAGMSGKDVKGLLGGNLQLTGSGTDLSAAQATGVLRISKAKLYKLPIMLGLLNVIFLTVPGDAAFTEGEINYYLKGQKITLREIDLRGPAISILGSGTVDLKTDALNLTFLTGPPGKFAGMRSLAVDMLQGILREIAEIHLTGTTAKPIMRPVPLRSIEALIRTLTNPEPRPLRNDTDR